MKLSIPSYVYWPSVCPPWRGVYFLIGLFVFLEWSHVSSLYILEIKPLSKVSLSNIFSHTVGSLFILLMFSLAVKKLFILMKSHLFILSFMSLAPGGILVKILLCGIPGIFLPVFSYRTFMLSWLIFKSFIHLEFILVYGINWWTSFIFLHVAVQIPQHHLLKKLFLLHFMLLPPLSILIDQETWVYFWALCSVPLIYVSVLMPVPDCFDNSSLVV